jgi:hypothetical protein
LLFLVDAELDEHNKLNVKWIRWHYGPFAKEILEAIEEMVEEGTLDVDSGPETRYILWRDYPDERSTLPEDVRTVIDKVVEKYGRLPLRDLLAFVYKEYGIDSIPKGEPIVPDRRATRKGLEKKVPEPVDEMLELVKEYLKTGDKEVLNEFVSTVEATYYNDVDEGRWLVVDKFLRRLKVYLSVARAEGDIENAIKTVGEVLAELNDATNVADHEERKRRLLTTTKRLYVKLGELIRMMGY